MIAGAAALPGMLMGGRAMAGGDEAWLRDELRERVVRCERSPGMVVGMGEGSSDGRRHRFLAEGVVTPGGAAVDERTPFEIGSVTKLFTSLVLAEMVVRGEVRLDAPVRGLLPEGVQIAGGRGDLITLAMLATHRSGLPRLPPNLDAESSDPFAGYDEAALHAGLAGARLVARPGTQVLYSNFGAGLLGHALGRASGLGYAGLLQARVLGPLGLADTTLDVPGGAATGHDDGFDPVPPWRFDALAGAGALRSTALDLLRFMEALGGVFAAAGAVMARPVAEGGLGQAAALPGGVSVLAHEGGTGGFRSYAGLVWGGARAAVVLTNSTAGSVGDLGTRLLDERQPLQRFRRPVQVSPAAMDRLAGRYTLRPGMEFQVTRSLGSPGAAQDWAARLMVQLTGQSAVQVFAMSEWEWFCKSVGAQLSFEPGTDGRAVRLVLHQNGLDTVAVRVE